MWFFLSLCLRGKHAQQNQISVKIRKYYFSLLVKAGVRNPCSLILCRNQLSHLIDIQRYLVDKIQLLIKVFIRWQVIYRKLH